MPEAASRHHRNRHAAGGHEGGQHERDLIPNAPGGVLVDRVDTGGPPENLAGVDHRVGQRVQLVRGHAAEEDRHHQGGHLIGGEIVPGVRLDDRGPFVGGKRISVALATDQLSDDHPGSVIGAGVGTRPASPTPPQPTTETSLLPLQLIPRFVAPLADLVAGIVLHVANSPPDAAARDLSTFRSRQQGHADANQRTNGYPDHETDESAVRRYEIVLELENRAVLSECVVLILLAHPLLLVALSSAVR